MNAERFRLVTVQDGHEFVSTVAISEEHAQQLIAVETLLHRAAGWRVTEGQGVVVARRRNVVRLVGARRFDGEPNDRDVAEGVQGPRVA